MSSIADRKRSAQVKAARETVIREAGRRIRGRPKLITLDPKMLTQIEALAMLQISVGDIAFVLGIGRQTFFELRRDHPEIQELIDQGRAKGVVNIVRKQYELAIKGDGHAQMLIWLGKQWAGQRDGNLLPEPTPETTGENLLEALDVSQYSDEQLRLLDAAAGLIIEGASYRVSGEGGDGAGAQRGKPTAGVVASREKPVRQRKGK